MPDERTHEGMVRLGGLWECKTSAGEQYLKGGLGVGCNLLVFKNFERHNESDPTHTVFVASKNDRSEYGRRVKRRLTCAADLM